MFDPDADKHVQDFDMVFETGLRDDFCRTWSALDLAPPDDACVPQGPTASAFLAFAEATKRAKGTYQLSDKSTFGSRSVFLRTGEPYSACLAGRRRLDESNGTATPEDCLYHDDEAVT